MTDALRARCESLLDALDLKAGREIRHIEPLTGGVASDIAMLDLGDEKICVKFALPRLKVAEEWQAPVHRNRAEYEWLRTAAVVAPENSLRMLGRSEDLHGFAMEFLEGEDTVLWKRALLDGQGDPARAAAVGALIGRIHGASTRPGFDRAPFDNRDDFHALRLEPYLVFTAGKHPEVSHVLERLAGDLYRADTVLVHGDVSPKNIMFRSGAPILLDAECTTMGAPEFDVAFCLNHLVLKAQHIPALRAGLSRSVAAFWHAYRDSVTWEPVADLERRVSVLLPALMLARIDGKSPVEYLSDEGRAWVRDMALALLAEGGDMPGTLDGLLAIITGNWKDKRS